MPATRNVAVIVGSLRKESFNRKLAKALVAMAPAPLALEILEIGHLPFYNADYETDPPAVVREFKQRLESFDAVLFVTPEYNRSVPGVLKNAIDVGSRPTGKSSWSRKPAAIISVSPGAIGAFGANHHFRQSLVFLDMPALQQPEAYVGNARTLLDDKGDLSDDATRDFMQKFLQAFAQWIARNAGK
jgi:chromate reductase